MKYFVTFCTSDQEVGSNLFWHSGLLLSVFDQDNQKMEVVDTWGFYALPKTVAPNSILIYLLNRFCGLDYDISGNHGWLRHEEYRYLDRGCGLHGVTFELTYEKFCELQEKCKKVAREQEEAIKEIVDSQNIKGKPESKTAQYAHEEHSRTFFALEKIKARQQGREPRLKPFEIGMSVGFFGPYMPPNCNTCKSQAISLLTGILSQQQIDRITENGKHPAFPRWSGKTEDMYLYTEGPLSEHIKRSQEKVYFRDGTRSDVKLYWTIPPQVFETIEKETEYLFHVDDEFCQELKAIAKKLQGLEWLFMNAITPGQYNDYKKALLDKIVEYYQELFEVCIQYHPEKNRTWSDYAMSLFSLPRNKDQLHLQKLINKYKDFFNTIYMAALDNWVIDESLEMLPMDEGDFSPAVEYNEIEAYAAYLSLQDKQKLCSILGRTYGCEERQENKLQMK